MEQVEGFGQGIDELLVLGGIFAKVDLGLAVAGIVVVLPTGEEVVARLIVVLVEDGSCQDVSLGLPCPR